MVTNLCNEFSTLFDEEFFLHPTKHNVLHYIRTEGPPCSAAVRRLSPDKLRILRTEIEHLLDLGIIEESEGPWGSPAHLVPKPGGKWRLVCDYRALNAQTMADTYALPLLNDLAGSQIFTSLNLYKSYHQIQIAETDQYKSTMVTPIGSYKWKRMSMDLKCASQTFQRFMHKVLRGVTNVFVYVDDILVFSRSPEEHESTLREVFIRLRENGLILNKDKCIFCVTTLKFLGFQVSGEGIEPLPEKVQALKDIPLPTSKRDLKRFLGMLNFYRRHLQHASVFTAPLDHMLTGKKAGNSKLTWDSEQKLAFDQVKTALANFTLLSYPVSGAPTFLVCDAFDVAVGAALNQEINGELCPLGFFSRALNKTQRNYSMFLAVKHFSYFLQDRPFQILTDHKPLTYAMKRNFDDATGRRLRQLMFISEFTTNIQYIEGEKNTIADCLSRPTDCLEHPAVVGAVFQNFETVDLSEIANAQDEDATVKNLINNPKGSLSFRLVPDPNSDCSVWVEDSSGIDRVVVPAKLTRRVFKQVHNLAHPGSPKTLDLIRACYFLPHMRRQIIRMAKSCIACQRAKVVRHNITPLHNFQAPDERFASIHCDLVGPLPLSPQGYQYLFTVIDRFSRHLEVIPLCDITAKTCADAFLLHWVARFGCPMEITCDRGAQFTSNLWHEMCSFLGCRINHTCSYRPQCNGIIERTHRTLKAALKAQPQHQNWIDNLPWTLLSLRTVPQSDHQVSSAQVTLGTTLCLPGQLLTPQDPGSPKSETTYAEALQAAFSSLRPSPTSHHNKPRSWMDPKLHSCTHCFVRNDGKRSSFDLPYRGPYRILTRHDKYFTLDLGEKETA